MTQKYTISLPGLISYITAALFLLYEMGIQSSPAVMANSIMHDLNLNAALLGWVIGSYFYSYTLMQIPVGLLFDRYPSRIILTFAIIICVLGNILFAIGTHTYTLALARFLMGIGSSCAFIGVLVNAHQHFPKRYFGSLVGVAQLLAAVGAMAGEMPLAAWVKDFGWRETTWILIFIGMVLACVVFLIISDPVDCCTEITKTKSSRDIKHSLRRIFQNSQTFYIGLYAFTAWAPITLFAELWGVPYLVSRFSMSNEMAASCCSIIWIALAITSPLLGWISDARQERAKLMQWCSLIGLVTSCILLFSVQSHTLIIVILLAGIGIAAAGQILSFAMVHDINSPQELATAIGFNNMAVVVGGAIFQPLVGEILSWHHHLSGSNHAYSSADYRLALIVIPLCYLVGWMVARFRLQVR